ncbi:hypothetical protein Zm00014a_031945 [Zea mays]|uniref:Uncharacterized protein n=1 Tax=Zea mays TaxID=4577 RepID=A0A3L6DBH6_MAIZE|nr:hypothetical protein Zm00014a_031945 [Zea mays]
MVLKANARFLKSQELRRSDDGSATIGDAKEEVVATIIVDKSSTLFQSIICGNLQYASLSALRRLPLDPAGYEVIYHGEAFDLLDMLKKEEEMLLAVKESKANRTSEELVEYGEQLLGIFREEHAGYEVLYHAEVGRNFESPQIMTEIGSLKL